MINELYVKAMPGFLTQHLVVKIGVNVSLPDIFKPYTSSLAFDSWDCPKPFTGSCLNERVSLCKRKRSKYDPGYTICGKYEGDTIHLVIAAGDWINLVFPVPFSILAALATGIHAIAMPIIALLLLPTILQRKRSLLEASQQLDKAICDRQMMSTQAQ